MPKQKSNTKVRPTTEFGDDTHEWATNHQTGSVRIGHAVMDLDDRLRAVERRLLILEPPRGILSKYPALKQAYEEYKLIEKLVLEDEKK